MIKNILFLFSLVLAISANAQKETIDNLDFVRKLSLETSQYIASGDFATAAEYIKPFWPMPESEFNKFIAQATKSFKYISEGMGNSSGISKVNEQILGEIVFREVYFIQYEEAPLRIEFVYYKTAKGWIINNIKWDVDFELEFD